jgi:hypothetical protein
MVVIVIVVVVVVVDVVLDIVEVVIVVVVVAFAQRMYSKAPLAMLTICLSFILQCRAVQ